VVVLSHTKNTVLALKFPAALQVFPSALPTLTSKFSAKCKNLSLLLLNETKFEIQVKSPNYSLYSTLSLLSIILPFRFLTFYLASRAAVQEELAGPACELSDQQNCLSVCQEQM
jgi:hypothetical protein